MHATTVIHCFVSQLVFLSVAILSCQAQPASAPPPAGELSIVGCLFHPTSSDPAHNTEGLVLLPASAVPANGRRRIRVVIYARFSTDQQSPRSINDQIAKCRQHLETLGLGDVQLSVINDQAISGEMTRRPGIDQIWDLIEKGGCDVIIAEDLSRLYRHSTRAMQLIEAAVDAGIRVVAINSNIDTIEDESRWRMGSHFASMKGEMDNSETRKRIVRAMEGLWRDGYAVGALKPGYIRVPTTPATDREPAKGPYRDQKDVQWTPVIHRAFKMCAQQDMPWVIARFLDDAGFPKGPRARIKTWTETNVIRLIRDPIYRGEESYRVLRSVKKYSLGKTVQVPSPADEVLYRKMPHLAHIPCALWKAANRAIDRRNVNRDPRSGDQDPNHHLNRDRRTALSQLFVCDVCGAKMYRQGDIYRCANSRHLSNIYRANGERCWNRCVLQLATVHENLARAMIETLMSQTGCFEALCTEVVRLVQQGAPEVARHLKELRANDADLRRKCQNLTKAIEEGSDISQLVVQLRDRELERRRIQTEIEDLVERSRAKITAPTVDEIRSILDDIQASFLGDFDSQAAPMLKRLIDGKIRAVPYRRFDGDSLHLRGHFTLNALRLLPQEWSQLLDDRANSESLINVSGAAAIPLVVDLFKVPKRIRYAKRIFALVTDGLTIAEAARQLDLPETTANKAYRTGRAMAEQGLNDAYIALTEMPARPGRWRPHTNRPDVFDRS